MKRIRKKLFLIFSILITIIGIFNFKSVSAATDEIKGNYVPGGISGVIGNSTFDVPNGNSDATHIISNTTNIDGSRRPDIYQLTNGDKQIASVWSKNDDADLDLAIPTKMSAWIYLGDMGGSGKAGDGMTFALQNDAKGTTALGGKDKNDIIGQALGIGSVWTNKWDSKRVDIGYDNGSLDNAIVNSADFEMDNYMNTDSDNNGSDFDKNAQDKDTKSHLATMYPGSPETYGNDHNQVVFTHHNRYFQNHDNLSKFSSSLSNGKWHHFELDYIPPAVIGDSSTLGQAMITIKFDDVDFNSETGTYSDAVAPISKSATLDTSKFYESPTERQNHKKGENNNHVKWGFTAATGSNYENNSVIFESIIGQAYPEVSLTAHDDTTDKDIDNTAKAGDSNESDTYNKDIISYTGTAKNVSGKTWTNVKAKFNIGKNLEYVPGTVKVNGTTVDDSDFVNDGTGVYTLNTSIGNIAVGDESKVTFKMKAINDNSDVIHTDRQIAYFTGENAIDNTAPFQYKINPKAYPEIKIDKPKNTSDAPYKIQWDSAGLDISGQVKDSDSALFAKLQYQILDSEGNTIIDWTDFDNNKANSNKPDWNDWKFTLPIHPSNSLKEDGSDLWDIGSKYQVKVRAYDDQNDESNIDDTWFEVIDGSAYFSETPSIIDFGKRTKPTVSENNVDNYSNERTDGKLVVVNDAKDSTYTVQASFDQDSMKNQNGRKLENRSNSENDGIMLWVKDFDSDDMIGLESNQASDLTEDNKYGETDYTDKIGANKWLLRVSNYSDNPIETNTVYKGTLTWTLKKSV